MNESTKDERIGAAYERLEGALAPPLDSGARIERRIAVRRRRRRVTTVGVAAAAAVAIGGTVAAIAGGDGPGGQPVAVDRPAAPASALVMTRPDGSTYTFSDLTVSCDPPGGRGSEQGPSGGRIQMSSPMRLSGDPQDDGTRASEPFVYFEGVVAKLQEDRTFELPVDGPGDSDSYPITLFVADSEGVARSNEVSSAQMGAAGTVRVLRASCHPTPVLTMEVDATLGSEVQQGTIDIAGVLR